MADTTQEQIVREAPDIEAAKVGLMSSAKSLTDATNAAALNGQYLTPDYRVAGMSPDQLNALDLGRQGIGAYLPYMQNATNQYQMAGNNVQQGINTLLGADTRNQFGAAQAAMNRAATPIANMGQSAQLATQGVGLIGQGNADIDTAQANLAKYGQANLAPSENYLNQSVNAMNQATGQPGFGQGVSNAYLAAEQAKLAAAQPGFNQATSTLQQGIGALGGGAQAYNPASAQQFMNPYQQQVIDEATRQINRQADIQRQNLQAQAVKAGAFGGSREGIQRAELERATAEQRNAAIVGALSSGYNTAQQQAQTAFEQQQQRQLAQAQGYQGAAGTQASIAAQQAGLGQSAAQQLAQAAQLQTSTAGQQAGLGQNAAQYMGNVGQTLGQQQLQQAQLGQAAANSAGNLGVQQAGLSGLYANLAGQQANIYNQQATAGMNMAQGIGSLAGQQFGIGQQIAQGLGSLGAQQGNLATQGAALGQAAQGMGQQDTNFLYNLGASQQKQLQSELDATRQNELTQNMQPYQQMAFLSDIYKGAPSSSMSMMQQSQATPSPFMQAAGLGIGATTAAAAAGRSGII
jgi:hypothetical protein